MELLQLYYFQVTARCEHISAAARELHIAQPALSQTIRRLEQELGTPLFDRIGKRIQLNDCGRIFLKYTDIALGALSDAKTEISEALSNPEQTITLCVQAASSLLPDILGQFRALHPQISFQIIQSTAATENTPDIDLTIRAVPRAGSAGATDWQPQADGNGGPPQANGNGGLPQASVNSCLPQTGANGDLPPNEDFCILLTEPLVIALPPGHPLAAKKELRLHELADQPFASLYKNSNLFRITKYYCNLAGFEPKLSLTCDNPQAFRELLHLNMGIAMIPGISWTNLESYGIITRKICDISCTRDILLSWNKSRYLCASAKLLRDFLREYFAKLGK